MDLLKKHYEKIILGVVLAGLAVAVAFLPFKIASEKQKLEDTKNSVLNPRVKPLTNLDLSLPELALKRAATPAVIDFSDPNKLFNPRAWQKRPDSTLILKERVGPVAMVVSNITPLYTRLTLDSVTVTSDGSSKYVIGVEREASNERKRQAYCKVNDKDKVFTLVEIKGKAEDPTQLIIQMNDTGERGVITKDRPYTRVDGYMADLRYDLERKAWQRRREGASLTFNGEDYKIVAINRDEVVLSAPNQKKWTIKQNLNPAP